MTQHNAQSTSEQPISENDLIAQRHAKLKQIQEQANRKPEFRLSIKADIGKIDNGNDDKEEQYRHPWFDMWPPKINILGCGSEFGHRDQNIQHPIVPTS